MTSTVIIRQGCKGPITAPGLREARGGERGGQVGRKNDRKQVSERERERKRVRERAKKRKVFVHRGNSNGEYSDEG